MILREGKYPHPFLPLGLAVYTYVYDRTHFVEKSNIYRLKSHKTFSNVDFYTVSIITTQGHIHIIRMYIQKNYDMCFNELS